MRSLRRFITESICGIARGFVHVGVIVMFCAMSGAAATVGKGQAALGAMLGGLLGACLVLVLAVMSVFDRGGVNK